ncbi:MAG TPA: tetratricopeptide repeat protein [Vicinamibacteria bacterium]
MRLSKLALAASALLALGATIGCGTVRARAAFKDGNKYYKEENFKKAIEEYTRAIEFQPEFPEALFFLGSSYQALFRPGNESPENVERLDKAIEYFGKSLDVNQLTTDNQKKVRTNTLAMLTGIYSEPPKQDFDKAFKYASDLLKEAPNDTKNLYALANLYEKFGKIPEAEETYRKVADLNPQDAKVCGALAAFYNKPLWEGRSRFDDAIATLERCASLDPNDASGYYKVATFFWDKAYRDPLLNDQQKEEYAEKGMVEVEKSLKIKPDYWEALITKGLLYRVKATVAKNPKQRNEFLEQAATIQKMALDLRKQQQTAAAEEAGAVPGEEGAAPAEGTPPS